MSTFSHSTILALIVTAPLFTSQASTFNIGIVVSDGNIKLNNALSTGSATVTDGSSVQTDETATSIRLMGGGRAIFGSASRGTLYKDRLILQQGSARIAGYSAIANSLKVNAEGDSSAAVSLRGKVVEVAALTGTVSVYSAAGVNVANVMAGEALDFSPQEGGAVTASSLTGCVAKSGEAYLLTDETSKVTVELRGGSLKAGQKIQVTGIPASGVAPAPGASQVINVSQVTKLRGGCKMSAATGAAAAGAGGGAAAGAGIGTTVAVVAGISVAAAVGITAGVLATNSSKAVPVTLSNP
jgi:hypothetical protein